MPDPQQFQPDPDFGAAFAGKPKAEKPSKTPPPASGGFTPDPAFGKAFSAQPAPTVPSERPHGLWGYATSSVAKDVFGTGASELYDKLSSNFPSLGKSYVGTLVRELGRGAPEVLDAATSPAGIALIGAHFFAPTAPIAMAADVGLGGMQVVRSIPSVINAIKDPQDPTKVAGAIKDLLYSYGLLKGPKALSEAGAPKKIAGEYSSRESTQALRELDRYKIKPKDTKKVREQKLEKRNEIWNKLANPESKGERVRLGLYRHAPSLSAMAGVKRPTILEVGADLVDRRNNFINLETYRANRMLWKLRQEVPAGERDVERLGYVMQGDATPDEVGLSDKTKDLLPMLNEWREAERAMLSQAHGGKIHLQDADTYLAQRWKFQDNEEYRNKLAEYRRRIMKDPYLKERKIQGYKYGIEELGMEPAERDVANIIQERHRTAVTAIANSELAKSLHEIGAIVTGQQARKIGLMSWPEAPDAPTLYRPAFAGRSRKTQAVDTPGGEQVFHTIDTIKMREGPVRVNPDVKMAVDAIFANPFSFPGFAPLEQMRAFGKMNAVMWSMFHNWAISEQAQAEMGGLGKVKEAGKAFFFANPEFYKGLRSGAWEVAGKTSSDQPKPMRMRPEVVEPWISAGARWGSTDAENAVISSMRKFTSPDFLGAPGKKVLEPTLHALGHAGYVTNRALWDYYLPGMYVDSAEMIFTREMNNLGARATPEQVGDLRRDIAKHLNETFGTTGMDSMLLHPKVRQAMYFVFFAPAWTLSNIRILTSGFENETQARLRNRWVRGAAITWFLSSELMNYGLSSWYGGTDKNGKVHPPRSPGWFSWDNPGDPLRVGSQYIDGLTDNSVNIYAGYNSDGSQRYVRFGKGFREPFSWLLAPIQTLGGKLSLFPLKWGITQITGVEPGSGYQVIDRNASPAEQAAQRTMETAKVFTPFIADTLAKQVERMILPELTPQPGTSQFWSLPTVKGMTVMRAADAYTFAMDHGRRDVATAVLKAAQINNISAANVVREYKTRKTRRRKTAEGPTRRFDTSGRAAPPQ